MGNGTKIAFGVVGIVLAACLCLSVVCIGAAGFLLYTSQTSTEEFPGPTVDFEPFPTVEIPDLGTPIPDREPTSLPTPEQTPTPFSSGTQPQSIALENLNILENNLVPENNPVDIAQRYKGVKDVAATLTPPEKPYQVGDKKKFWMSNSDTQSYRQVSATLRYATPHLYFWVEDSAKYNLNNIKKLCNTFENKIYPTDRKFFGSEWSPGIDGEDQLYVLYAKELGSGVAGFFSSVDEIPPAASEYSNGHEMFVVSADNTPLTSSYDYGVFAHEFQHMIHFRNDRNEEIWLNEGFSELAQLLNGYDTGSSDQFFLQNPDLQLNTWEPNMEQNHVHYGASFLFFSYFLGRFGDQATQAVVANTENGWDSIDAVLKQLGLKNASGAQMTADEVFADWAVANIVSDKTATGGLYDYKVYPDAPKAEPAETIDQCPVSDEERTVHQYGTQYIALTCPGSYTLDFQGAPEAALLPASPSSGDYAFWTNRGDESDMMLTHAFDLSAVSGPVAIQYSAWFNIEENYDYLYLSVSEDGKTWKTLELPSGTQENPGGANLGWGYTGDSSGWLQEEVDLSAYAGKKIQLRFEYITDTAVTQNGFLVDDIAIPALNYQTDFEKDDGGWEAAGFARVSNSLPQTFRVSLVSTNGSKASVQALALDETQHGTATVKIANGEQLILVVSGTTRFTTQTGGFRFSVR